jgi:hypothetical protein
MRWLLWLPILAACQRPIPTTSTPAAEVDGGPAVTFEVEPSVGSAPHTVTVRARNKFGIPTMGEALSLDVAGQSIQVTFDAFGLGTFELAASGAYDVTGGAEPVTILVTDAPYDGFLAMPALPSPDDVALFARPVTNGALVATANRLWFVDPRGRAHRVVDQAEEILDLRVGHIDPDGLLDAVVTTATTVFMLRGGMTSMSWGTALQAEGYTAAGATVGDVSNDGNGDVIVAWQGQTKHYVDFWESDGLWNYSPTPPRLMLNKPISVDVGDQLADGELQVTVMHDQELWARFVQGEPGTYIPIGPELELVIPTEGTVETGHDINGDGADELVVFGPYHPATALQMLFFDLYGDQPEYIPVSALGAYTAIVDTNNDGVEDVMTLDSNNKLESIAYNGATYPRRQAAILPSYGPIAFGKFLQLDPIPELLLAADDRWSWFTGGTQTQDDVWWAVAAPEAPDAGVDSYGPTVRVEFDGDDATGEVVGFHMDGADPVLKVWQLDASGMAIELESVPLLGGNPLDLAVCGTVAWAVTEGRVSRVRLDNGTDAGLNVEALRVDCGIGPNNGQAVILTETRVQELSSTLNLLESTVTEGVVDVAFSNVGGVSAVDTCSEIGCSVAAWDLGDDALVVGGDVVTVEQASGTTTLEAAGDVTTVDIDGNGTDDLLVTTGEGDIWIYRAVDGAFGPPELYATTLDFAFPPTAAIGATAGRADLWVTADDRLVRIQAGAVDTVEAVEPEQGDTDTDSDTDTDL